MFETLGTIEAAAVRVSAYLLGGEATDVHSEKFELVEFDFDGDSLGTKDDGLGRMLYTRFFVGS